MSTTRSNTLNNVWSFLGGSLGLQGHEKALKTALYNALAMLLLVVCCAALYALFFILDPFIKPLIWALLLGSVLHPFKYSLVSSVKNWLDSIESNGTPIAVAFFMIPIHSFDRLSDYIGDLIYKYLKTIFILSVAAPLLLVLYCYTPQMCVCLLWRFVYALYAAVNWVVGMVSGTLFTTVLCCYLAALSLWWRPESASRFILIGCGMWVLAACYIARFVGPSYQVIAFAFLQTFFVLGFMYEKWGIHDLRERHSSIVESLIKSAAGSQQIFSTEVSSEQSIPVVEFSGSDTEKEISNDSSDHTVKEAASVVSSTSHITEYCEVNRGKDVQPSTEPQTHLAAQAAYQARPASLKDISAESDVITSERCLCVLGWTCLALFLWNHMWLLHFMPITILTYIIKHLGIYFGIWSWVSDQLGALRGRVVLWCSIRQDALCPSFVRGLLKIQSSLYLQIIHSIKDSADTAASILVILALLVFVISTTIFISVNIYTEGIHLVQVAGNVINSTVNNNQEVLALLPEGVQEKLHLVLDNAYLYGRQTISNMVHAMLKNVDPDKAEQLEERVLELWDRVYQAWMMTSTDIPGAIGPKVSSGAVYASWESFLDGVQKTPELLNLDGLMQFAKENVGMLSSLLESLWDIFKGNVSLMFHSLLTLFSVVLGGGSAVINFIINSVVFFTALFYLLSSSGSVYRPVELVASFSPSSGNKVAVAIDGAVGDVFRASFKMALFHGLWAWLIHTLFQVKVVYLPSVLAAILGVVPFLGTYWACIPAVLELWLAQGCALQAVFMMLAFYIPTSWVNSIVYEEIKGGHPYLTGLSIAGGVYCMGSEGAIFGPLLLCCVFVVLNISSSLMMEPSLSQLSPLNMLRNIRPLRRRQTLVF